MSTRDHIELKPIRETPADWDEIEKRIKAAFRKEIYSPLMKEFSEPVSKLKNSIDQLVDAIQSGRLTYNRGKFSGRLNSTLSKELRKIGARWDRREKCYSIPTSELPLEIRNVISASNWRFADKISKIDQKLASILPEQLASKIKLTDLFDRAIFKVEKDFDKSVKNITVAPQFTKERQKKLSDEWQKNMDIWIKDFTSSQIKQLRSDLAGSVFAGNRYESAVKSIKRSYRVTERKAKFLARQETALAMTTYKYARYEEVGVNEYKWRSVIGTGAHPVRPRHKELNDASTKGTIFRLDKPPVTSEPGQPKRRNNPGMDFNCRCTAIPIVRFKK